MTIYNTNINWAQHYNKGECPDCGINIPKHSAEGNSCIKCGHVFIKAIPFKKPKPLTTNPAPNDSKSAKKQDPTPVKLSPDEIKDFILSYNKDWLFIKIEVFY